MHLCVRINICSAPEALFPFGWCFILNVGHLLFRRWWHCLGERWSSPFPCGASWWVPWATTLASTPSSLSCPPTSRIYSTLIWARWVNLHVNGLESVVNVEMRWESEYSIFLQIQRRKKSPEKSHKLCISTEWFDVRTAVPGNVAVGVCLGLYHGSPHCCQQAVPPSYPQALNVFW